MPRKKRTQASDEQVILSLWRRYKTARNLVLSIAGAIVVLGGAYAVVVPALEGYIPVTHASARETIIPRIIFAQLDANKERRERLLRENKDRELELQSLDAQKLPKYKQELQDGIDRNSNELKALEQKDKSLFKEQEGLKK